MVSLEDHLHEMSEPVLWVKVRKYNQFVICWIRPESGES